MKDRSYIRNDANTSWLRGSNPGAKRMVANGYGQRDTGGTHVNRSDNDMMIAWNLVVKSPFKGTTVNV